MDDSRKEDAHAQARAHPHKCLCCSVSHLVRLVFFRSKQTHASVCHMRLRAQTHASVCHMRLRAQTHASLCHMRLRACAVLSYACSVLRLFCLTPVLSYACSVFESYASMNVCTYVSTSIRWVRVFFRHPVPPRGNCQGFEYALFFSFLFLSLHA
jgi:hypothetical protein